MALIEIGCPVDDNCDCVPITVSKQLGPVIAGKPYLSTAEFAGTDPILEVIFISDGMAASVAKNIITVSGTTKNTVTVIVKATNDCTDCETLTLKATSADVCVPISMEEPPGDLALDPVLESVSVALEIIGSNITVVPVLIPGSASFSVAEGYLTITSTDVGDYKVILKNECSELEISGRFTSLASLVCIPLAYDRTIGSPIFKQDEPNSFSWVVTGSRPITIEQAPQDLQAGLTYKLDTSHPTETLLTVSGTAILKPCDAEGATSCRQSCFTLLNGCKELIVCTTISFAGTPVDNTPKFCAGFVTIEEVLPIVPPNRCWKITASMFEPDTTLTISASPSGTTNPPISGDTEIALDGEGAGTGTVCVQVSGSGCAFTSLIASHPTCAVMTNRAQITPMFQFLDCPPDTAGGQ